MIRDLKTSFGDCGVIWFIPVTRVIIKILTSLDSSPVTTILILEHGDKSTGIYLCRKSYCIACNRKGGRGNWQV